MLKMALQLAFALTIVGCAGVKVVNPNDQNKEAGTKILDLTDGRPKLVSTYSCKVKSMGNKFSAIGKTEKEAREEVLAKCRERTALSFCKADKVTCQMN